MICSAVICVRKTHKSFLKSWIEPCNTITCSTNYDKKWHGITFSNNVLQLMVLDVEKQSNTSNWKQQTNFCETQSFTFLLPSDNDIYFCCYIK